MGERTAVFESGPGEPAVTIDHRFSSTVPAPLDGVIETAAAVEPADAMRRLEFEVTGTAAAELATVLVGLRAALDALLADGTLNRTQARPMEVAMEAAARIVMHGRLLAKVATGSVRHNHVQTSLDQILRLALDNRLKSSGHGMEVRRRIKPVMVVVDRDLAAALVDALLDWALGPGKTVDVTLEIKDWPAHGLLRVNTTQEVRTEDVPDPQERLSWHLVTEICRAIGATLDRVQSAGQTLVMVEFPRTVREMEGISAMEVDLGAAGHAGDGARMLAGHRALIVSSDVKLREEIKKVCQDMGLTVDTVPSSTLAAQRCEQELPDLIIVDERFNDGRFGQLRARLASRQANFPSIEIAYSEDAALSLEGWGNGGMTRVSRKQLGSQLPQALALEMSKVL